jgi:hypothetical protein
MTAFRSFRSVVAVAACALVAGCATLRQAPPLPLEVTFVADRGFVLEAAPGSVQPSGVVSRCEVRRADVRLAAVRGDTVFFDALKSHSAASGKPRCSLQGAGIIDLASQPQVQAERGRRSAGRTIFGVFAGLMASYGAMFVYLALTGQIGWGT